MPPLFPSVPEDLETVEADGLRQLLTEFQNAGAALHADMQLPQEEREIIPADMKASELDEQMAAAISDRKRVQEALEAREEAESTFTTKFEESLAALGVEVEEPAAALEAEPEPEPVPEPDPDTGGGDGSVVEPTEETPAEPLAAETETEPERVEESTPKPALAIPRGGARHAAKVPTETSGPVATVVAHRGLQQISVREGAKLDRMTLANALLEYAQKLGRVEHVRGGGRDYHKLARIEFPFPEEFKLNPRDQAGNLEKLRAIAPYVGLGDGTGDFDVWTAEILQAAGGICAPPTPFYDVPGFASRARPVRAGLPSVNAPRGGISVPGVNLIARDDTGVTVIEADEDAQGGTFAEKSCRTVECVDWTETFIGAIAHCLEVGNFNARTWPEGVALEEDNLMAAWAGTAERRLLDRIKALSAEKTTAHVYNAVHDLIYGIARSRAHMRYELRAEFNAAFTAIIPEFVVDMLISDLAAQSAYEERYVAAMGAVERYLSAQGVNVIWAKDTPTGVTPYTAVADDGAAVADFPDTVQYALFLNGAFLHMDGGSLELGLVRDSTLNHTNDYELFGESFENVARIGPLAATRWITATICPSGQFPDLATALSCA